MGSSADQPVVPVDVPAGSSVGWMCRRRDQAGSEIRLYIRILAKRVHGHLPP